MSAAFPTALAANTLIILLTPCRLKISMNPSLKPIHLFADSQLLFWRQGTKLFMDSLKNLLANRPSKAAYIGASNGDNPEYYSIFEAAMEKIDINDCRMIQSAFTETDAAFVDEADIILLAGGDVCQGWDVMSRSGMKEAVIRRYQEGALLIGISAGAVQLGLFGWPETTPTPDNMISTFKLVPFIVGVHDEKQQWQELKTAVHLMGGMLPGIGIPSGGGLLYHADKVIEPIRYPVHLIQEKADETHQTLLMPLTDEDVETAPL